MMRTLLIDALTILGVATGITFFSGSERFTGLYTPDSEFYLSIASFGHAVTDRSPVPAYYWTRLGEIVPLRVLSQVVEFQTAWSLYRYFMVTLIVGSIYVLARKQSTTRLMAAFLAACVVTNTVILYFVGDTYNTGTVLAWLFVLISVSIVLDIDGRRRMIWGNTLGFVLCTLLMSNPTGLLVGLTLMIAILVVRSLVERRAITHLIGIGVAIGLGFMASLGCYFLAAQRLFPLLNWYGTVRYYVSVINPSGYASNDIWTWLKTESSLLVPVLCFMLSVGLLATYRKSWRQWILPSVIAGASPVLFVAQFVKSRGPNLEASFYSAMLWPGSIAALVLSSTLLLRRREYERGRSTTVVIMAAGSSLWLGNQVIDLTRDALLLGAATTLGCILVLRRRSIALVAVMLCFPIAQVLQNGRPWGESVVPRNPYVLAFRESGTEEVVRQNLEAQSWVLSQTFPTDKTLVYADFGPSAVTAAAMQLWGPNAASTNSVVGEWERANIINVRPSVLVTYFRPTKGYALRRDEFVGDLLKGLMNEVSVSCRRFKPAGDLKLEVCIRRLQPVPSS